MAVERERNYGFRARLDVVHQPGRRAAHAGPEPGETVLQTGWQIRVPESASPYLIEVAKDLQDYLFTSMGVSVLLLQGRQVPEADPRAAPAIVLGTAAQLPAAGRGLTVPRSYRVGVEAARVVVCGRDERGVAQGCYWLEDVMNLREAPFLSRGEVTREPIFSPRMVHSGWGLDQFPDAHLRAVAHAGFDAILVFAKGPNHAALGFLDFDDLVRRAASHGLDVYLYSYLVSRRHPDDPDAEAYYEATYGALVRAHPGIRGIVLVGESCEFPSKDPRTTGRLHAERLPEDRRPSPGWWPCVDFPQWLALVKRVLRRHNPDLDVVFWTYNWGWAPAADRLALIRSLPDDISLQATFEMFEDVERRGVPTRCVDYTVSFAGPGRYFASEAAAAHARGLRLYAMSNTAGMTWDIGVIPYEPVPWQWARRHRALLAAARDWGLCGLMESHHMGWWPSVVAELAKWAFWRPCTPAEELLPRLARRDFGAAGAAAALQAWADWSAAILDYVPTNEDQYGPFRVRPAYPLLFAQEEIEFPAAAHAHFGSRILQTRYTPHDPAVLGGEIRCLESMAARWERGVQSMRLAASQAPPSRQAEAHRAQALGEFILCCIRTTVHVKQWWQLRQALRSVSGDGAASSVLDQMRALAAVEIDNARAAIPLVDCDSRLGWEPSMEYMADRVHLEWKIAQVRHVLDSEIPAYQARQPHDGA